jgi:hypothetical protein
MRITLAVAALAATATGAHAGFSFFSGGTVVRAHTEHEQSVTPYPGQERLEARLFDHTVSVATNWFGDAGAASRLDMRFAQKAANPILTTGAWALSSPISFIPAMDCFYRISGEQASTTLVGTIQANVHLWNSTTGQSLFRQEETVDASQRPVIVIGREDTGIGSRTGMLRAGELYMLGYYYRTNGGFSADARSNGYLSLVLTPIPTPAAGMLPLAALVFRRRSRPTTESA